MPYSCSFYFHGSLNDFLPNNKKKQRLLYTLNAPASAKDAIEAIGVPHVEVKMVVVNTQAKPIHYLLQANEDIEIFLYENAFPQAAPRSFVLDVHLGQLARKLRLLGIDALYENNLSDAEIVAIAVAQNRAVLTRDKGLLKHKLLAFGYWLRSQQPDEQLLEVVKWFLLCAYFEPFNRCMRCNGRLQPVEKKMIAYQLPAQIKIFFDSFCNAVLVARFTGKDRITNGCGHGCNGVGQLLARDDRCLTRYRKITSSLKSR